LVVLFLSLAVALGLPLKKESPPHPDYRLLKISEEQPAFWVPSELIDVLSASHLNFADLTDHQTADRSLAPKSTPLPSGPSHQSEVNQLISRIDMNLYSSNLETLSAFQNRYYTGYGAQSADWIYNLARQYAANRTDIVISKFTHNWAQPSVIARIPGSSTVELVLLGSHQDSTSAGMPNGRAPGADDDGSGSAALLEILRLLVGANFRPEFTVELHWYAAEEVGLLGSAGVAQNYQSQQAEVRGMMQLDMIAYDEKEITVGVVTDYTDAAVNAFTRLLVDEYLQIGWTNTICGYGCSDHASWDRYGYPAAFPFEARFANRNPYIHTTSDTMTYVSIEHAQEFVKLGLGFVVELAYE